MCFLVRNRARWPHSGFSSHTRKVFCALATLVLTWNTHSNLQSICRSRRQDTQASAPGRPCSGWQTGCQKRPTLLRLSASLLASHVHSSGGLSQEGAVCGSPGNKWISVLLGDHYGSAQVHHLFTLLGADAYCSANRMLPKACSDLCSSCSTCFSDCFASGPPTGDLID